jgi:hypothetical protein
MRRSQAVGPKGPNKGEGLMLGRRSLSKGGTGYDRGCRQISRHGAVAKQSIQKASSGLLWAR